MTAKVYLQPAFILQQRHYRESSLIIDVLTRDYGRISVLAKGVRKAKSKTAGLLQAFLPLALSYLGRPELKILTDVEVIPPRLELKGMALYCGFYVNELTAHFLHKHDPHPEVFALYGECLLRLTEGLNLEAALRVFEFNLINAVGYGFELDYDADQNPVAPLKTYIFQNDRGLVADRAGYVSGQSLLALKNRRLTDAQALSETKTLMRCVIAGHLQGKPLKSKAVIHQIIKQI